MLPVCFLSDYGLHDEYVGVCHGVIKRAAPGVEIIDITHGVPARDVRTGALALRRSIPFLPEAVLLAVVDPGVGTERRPLALRCADETLLVGPDNGLLWPVATDRGGIVAASDLSDSPHNLQQVSATFHGRDVFAPAAAQLACSPDADLPGTSIAPDQVQVLQLPQPAVSDGAVTAHVLSIDRFGNVQLDATADDLQAADLATAESFVIDAGHSSREVRHGSTFGDVATREPLLYKDSSGLLALAVNNGNASELFDLSLDDELTLRI